MWLTIVIIGAVIFFLFFYQYPKKKNSRSKNSAKGNVSQDIKSVSEFSEVDLVDFDPYYKIYELLYNEDSEEPNIPNNIRIGRMLNKGKKLCDLHQRYFSILPNLMENKSENIIELLGKVEESLQLMEPFIIFEKKCSGTFQIKSIPSIENGLLYSSLIGNYEKANDIKKTIDFFPELDFYKRDAIEAIKFCHLLPRLLEYIKVNNGIKVNDLKETFLDDYDLIKNRLYYLSKIGTVKKRKIGNYNFYEI